MLRISSISFSPRMTTGPLTHSQYRVVPMLAGLCLLLCCVAHFNIVCGIMIFWSRNMIVLVFLSSIMCDCKRILDVAYSVI